MAVFAADAVAHHPAGAPPVCGRLEIRDLVRSIFAAAQPLEVREDVLVCGRSAVAVRWSGRWRMLSGEVALGGIDVFELDEEGRVVAWWAHWDPPVSPA